MIAVVIVDSFRCVLLIGLPKTVAVRRLTIKLTGHTGAAEARRVGSVVNASLGVDFTLEDLQRYPRLNGTAFVAATSSKLKTYA